MSSSENILQRVRMFVTDADGTLLGHRPEFEQYRAFRIKMEELRTVYDCVWVVCTGRSLRSFNRVFLAMRTFGIVPDFVIGRHAYIYEKARIGYKPHWLWNLQVLSLQWRDALEIRRAIPRLRRAVLSRNPFARVAYEGPRRICFRFDDDGAANFGAEILRTAAEPYKYLQIFHHLREVDVRSVPFTKGLAVSELARRLNIETDRILVVGDGHNDISMMQPNRAAYVACPSNAAPEVIATVHRAHGHIAGGRSLAGVMEILSAYETGQINDQLPETWTSATEVDNPVAPPRKMPVRFRDRLYGVLLFVAVVYTTLIVLASFCKVPGRKTILRPYQRVIDGAVHVVQMFSKQEPKKR